MVLYTENVIKRGSDMSVENKDIAELRAEVQEKSRAPRSS